MPVELQILTAILFLVYAAVQKILQYKTRQDMKLLADSVQALRKNEAHLEEDNEKLLEQLRLMTIKAESAMSSNADFQSSRDQAWDLYRRSSLGAGNAQAWLFRELQKTMGVLNQYRLKSGESPLKVPADLEDAVATFSEKHVKEAATIERPKSDVG